MTLKGAAQLVEQAESLLSDASELAQYVAARLGEEAEAGGDPAVMR